MNTTRVSALRPPRLLLNLLLAGFLLRMLALGYWSLWLDEGATWSWTVLPTWKDTALAEANHPPLWWLVTRAWTAVFGDSEAALRAPAAILGVVSMFLAWFLGLRLLDPAHQPRRGGFDPWTSDGGRGRRAAVWFAALVATSSYFVEYAQEARMYTALLVETLGLSLLYLRWLEQRGRGTLAAYAVLGAVTLYTHYFGIFPLFAHAAHALWLARRTRRTDDAIRAAPLLAAVAAAGLAFVPWFVYLVTHYQKIAHIAPEPFGTLVYIVWRMGAGPGLVAPDRLRQIAGPEAVLRETWPQVLVIAVLFFVPLVLGAVAMRKKKGVGSFVVANLVVPIVVLLAVYWKFPLLHERRLIFLAPWIFLLVAMGVLSGPRRLQPLLRGGVVLLIAVGIVAYHGASRELVPEGHAGTLDGGPVPERFVPDPEAPLYALHGNHPYGREPWRQAHAFVEEHAREGDLVALHPGYVHLAWDYYASRPPLPGESAAPRLETLELPEAAWDAGQLLEAFGETMKDRRRIFVVFAHEETADPDHYYKVLLTALARLWVTEDGGGVSAIPPILFHASWGVRVAVFTRQ